MQETTSVFGEEYDKLRQTLDTMEVEAEKLHKQKRRAEIDLGKLEKKISKIKKQLLEVVNTSYNGPVQVGAYVKYHGWTYMVKSIDFDDDFDATVCTLGFITETGKLKRVSQPEHLKNVWVDDVTPLTEEEVANKFSKPCLVWNAEKEGNGNTELRARSASPYVWIVKPVVVNDSVVWSIRETPTSLLAQFVDFSDPQQGTFSSKKKALEFCNKCEAKIQKSLKEENGNGN